MEYVLVVATLLGGLSAAWYFWEEFKSRRQAGNDRIPSVPQSAGENANSDQQVLRLVEQYHHLTITDVCEPGILRFDLTGSGKVTEFAVLYRTQTHTILDVFTNRRVGLENLFHRIRIDEELMPDSIVIDHTPYFICADRSGSGRFMNLSLYSYDGIGKLTEVFKLGPLFQGLFWVTDSRLFISGDNKRFEVRREDGSFILVPYDKKPEAQRNPGTHVLSLFPSGDLLQINYDETSVEFKLGDTGYRSIIPIRLQLEEVIIVDDNLVDSAPQAIRILINGSTFDGHRHFFYSIHPIRRAESDIRISYNYGDWYIIDVIVE